jgi:polysaccharide export outer membrane protein
MTVVMSALVVSLFAAQAPAQEYEVGPGDVLGVVVLNQAGLTGEFAVDPEGFLDYPFVGRVKAAGLSADEIERKLVTLLSDGYLRRPQVAVTVKQYKSHRVFVTGEAKAPGPYGLRPDRMLSSLLADVGELTPQAGHEVIIVRPPSAPPPPVGWEADPGSESEGTNGDEPAPEPSPSPEPTRPPYPGEVPGSEILRVKLREVRSGYPDKDVRLQIGDTVYFPKAAQIYLTGHVARPGAYRYDETMTLFQALAQAGSVTERGSMKRVRVIRMIDGRRKEVDLKPNDVLQPEDTIHVPERFF